MSCIHERVRRSDGFVGLGWCSCPCCPPFVQPITRHHESVRSSLTLPSHTGTRQRGSDFPVSCPLFATVAVHTDSSVVPRLRTSLCVAPKQGPYVCPPPNPLSDDDHPHQVPIPKFAPMDEFSANFMGRLVRELQLQTESRKTVYVNQLALPHP